MTSHPSTATRKVMTCTCGRPDCPGEFTGSGARKYANPDCERYAKARKHDAQKAAGTLVRKQSVISLPLPGDKYCSPCGKFTDTFSFSGWSVCKECGEER